jgi:hypothetical protein
MRHSTRAWHILLLVSGFACMPSLNTYAWFAGLNDWPIGYRMAFYARLVLIAVSCFQAIHVMCKGRLAANDKWQTKVFIASCYLCLTLLVLAIPGPRYWSLKGFHRRVCAILDKPEVLRWVRAIADGEATPTNGRAITDVADLPPSLRQLVGDALTGRLINYRPSFMPGKPPYVEILHEDFIILISAPLDHELMSVATNGERQMPCGPEISIEIGSSGIGKSEWMFP